ncbi:sulfurtransferase [uncultured Cocleimonas sp.]|uniref:sulfurtransferase n=1 Tax=uncultured Cocleimonas sp. TaxID=1051587 RepID=UPI002631A7B6|nr:sulfurtransferase [uncultured Cocleimonas sp.]
MTDKILISPHQLQQMAESLPTVIIDTRSPEAYAAGHIPGAVNLHDIFTFLATSTKEGLEELRGKFASAFGDAGLSGEEVAVIYEDSMDTGFGQSCRGYFLLEFLGYPKAAILHGGYKGWLAEKLPISDVTSTPEAKTFPVDTSAANVMLTKDDMLESLNKPEIIKLDVRDVDEWVATSSSPYGIDFCPRKGRIPGAVWLEWYRMMKPGEEVPVFKSKEELQAESATVGIGPDSTVYVYCFKGARASNTYIALKEAGVKDVRIYFGSWNEWSRDPELPIEEGHQIWAAA